MIADDCSVGSDSEDNTYPVHYVMMPAALFGLHTMSTHMTSLWQQMKQAAAKLSSIIPNDFYLPAPSLYCPQVEFDPQVRRHNVT